MNKKNFDVYLNLSAEDLSITVFDKMNNENIFYSKLPCFSNLDTNFLNLQELDKILENNILEIEKTTDEHLKEIFLMVDTANSISICLSLIKNNEYSKIKKKDVQYLIQDAKQQILRSYLDLNIVHIIVTKYFVDNIEYDYLPTSINCKKFSLDIKFICFPKNLTRGLMEVFSSHQIFINRMICTKYAKSLNEKLEDDNICEYGLKLVEDINKQEVVIIPKKLEKKGFFERLFHFLN